MTASFLRNISWYDAGMPTKVNGLRELAKHVLEASPGDSFGLRYDLETQLLLIEGIVEQFSQSLAPELLEQWRGLVDGVERDFDLRSQSVDLRSRVQTHRLMLDMAEKLMAMKSAAIPSDPSVRVEDR